MPPHLHRSRPTLSAPSLAQAARAHRIRLPRLPDSLLWSQRTRACGPTTRECQPHAQRRQESGRAPRQPRGFGVLHPQRMVESQAAKKKVLSVFLALLRGDRTENYVKAGKGDVVLSKIAGGEDARKQARQVTTSTVLPSPGAFTHN